METWKKKKNVPPRFRLYTLTGVVSIGLLIALSLLMQTNNRPVPPTSIINVPFGTSVRLVETGTVRYNRLEAKKAIAGLIDTPLPASATNFWYYELIWREMTVWIRFDAEPDELSRWLQAADQVCHDLQPQVMPYFSEPTFQEAWWQPETATRYAGQSCGEPVAYHTLIDMTQPGIWTVYLQIFFE